MKLEEYEEICPECKRGYSVIDELDYCFRCARCRGRGKIDWVDKIMGVRKVKYKEVDLSRICLSKNQFGAIICGSKKSNHYL